MLVTNVAAVRNSVAVVVGVWPETDPGTGQVSYTGAAFGTACYVGSDLFLTAAHLFQSPKPGQRFILLSVPVNGGVAQGIHPNATVELALGAPDLAIMRAPGVGTTVPPVKVDPTDLPDGRSVFSYGFPNPIMSFTQNGPMMDIWARACPSVISAHVNDGAGTKYMMDGSTYPGESGSPVFRCSDNALVAVVQSTRIMHAPMPTVPSGQVRGPTIAGPLGAIAGELVSRGVALIS